MSPNDAAREAADRRATAMVVSAMAALTLLVSAIAFARFARHYFFLFDDFALIDIARRETLARIAAQPLIGFYRPLAFWMLRAEAITFAWDAPAAYIAISLLLHVANAALCGLLTRTFNPPRFAPILAGCLFLLSPWATEAFLWLSGRFDLMATLGVLAALLGVRMTVTVPSAASRSAVPALALALTCAGSLFAMFSKEPAILLPVLALLVIAADADRPLRSLIRPPALLAIAATAVPAAMYLAVRAHVMIALQGAYGNVSTLWREGHVPENVWSYVRAFAWIPTRPAWPPQDITAAIMFRDAFVGVVLPIAAIALLWRHRRLAAVCAAAFLVSVTPVSWFGLSSQSTIGGRFAYLPATWLVIALAVGLAEAIDALPALKLKRSLPAPLVAMVVWLVTFGYTGGSLLYQVGLWQLACGLANTTFEQLEPYRGRHDIALQIENMPNFAAEGPYVLKAYAFHLYRPSNSQPLPPINAQMALVKLAWNGEAISNLGVDPASDFLDRPPAGLTIHPIHLRLIQPSR